MNSPRIDEISRILHTSRDVRSFYQNFLAVSANMSGAQVGVAWRGVSAPFQPICQVQAQETPAAKLSISEQRHNELLERAAQSDKAFIILPKQGADTEPALMFGQVRRDDVTEVVEFIIPPGDTEIDHREIVQQLNAFCTVASQFRESASDTAENLYNDAMEAEESDVEGLLPTSRGFRPLTREEVDQYAHQVHGSLDYKETASRVANEARRVLDCDRVSVVLRKGNDYRVIAVSGQPSVNRRSTTVNLLRRVASKTLKTGQRFWYPDSNRIPPQIEKPLNEYLGISATRSLAILPIFDRVETDEADPEMLRRKRLQPKVIAGLIIEHCNEQWNRQLVAPSIEIATRHGGDAIRNSLGHRQLFLYPLWRMLGQSTVVFAARNLSKTAAVVGGIAMLTAILSLIPAPFTLKCDGVLIPETRAKVYSAQSGRIDEINVSHGDFVTAGQSLLRIENEDIEVELEQINAEIERQKKRLEKNRVMRSASRESDSESRGSMDDNAQSIEAEIKTLESRREILNGKSEKLNVTSRIDGQVITWDLENRLADRPVKPGDTLLEVADVDGVWQLELELADRRVGHLLEAFEKQKSDGGEGLKVSYQLAAEPGQTFTGRVSDFSRASRLTADQKQTVIVTVEIETKDIEKFKQARSGVSAKIHCGRAPLGYVWLHDVYEFFQSKIVFNIW